MKKTNDILDMVFMSSEELTHPKFFQTANIESLKKATNIGDRAIISYLSPLYCHDENKVLRIDKNNIPLSKTEINQIETFLENKIIVRAYGTNNQNMLMFIDKGLKNCLFGNNNVKSINKPCLQTRIFGKTQFCEILGENFQAPYFWSHKN